METTRRRATVAVFAGTFGVASSSSWRWSHSSRSTTSPSACLNDIGMVTTLEVPGEAHNSYRT